MTRYLIFVFLGLTLSFFILITAPDNSKLADAMGLITLAIGTGLYLKQIKLAGLLSSIGLGIILHVISAWWYNLIIIYAPGMEKTPVIWIFIYILLTMTFMLLLGIGVHSVITIKKTANKLDNIIISKRKVMILTILPLCLMIVEILYCFEYMR